MLRKWYSSFLLVCFSVLLSLHFDWALSVTSDVANNSVSKNEIAAKSRKVPKPIAERTFPGLEQREPVGSLSSLVKPKAAPVLCEHFNPSHCNPATTKCDFYEECDASHGFATQACFALWSNNSGELQILLKGCWNTKDECLFDDDCISPGVKTDNHGIATYFCCCSTSKCNERIRTQPKNNSQQIKDERRPPLVSPSDHWLHAILYAFLPVCTLALLIFMVYWVYRRYRYSKSALRETYIKDCCGGPNKTLLPSQLVGNTGGQLRPIQLIDIKARGRFGCVYHARWLDHVVAVKTFPVSDEDSWVKEQEIYSTPGLRKHANILEFLGAEVRGTGPHTEYWLITAYHDNGSLCDYLKGHELTIPEALHISVTMMAGLTFLHEEMMTEAGVQKPCVAHRDFKSKNVLLKTDLTACIADFGLSMKFESGHTLTDEHGQVGTHRYMSPEVLEGATEFSAFAFRQIDVYAAALVLWEILSRSKMDSYPVEQYKLPFEEELGLRPKVSEMQMLVVTNRQRPKLKDTWKTHPQLSVICATMNDMWDPEPEARITAGCALERLAQLLSTRSSSDLASAPVLPISQHQRLAAAPVCGHQESVPLIENCSLASSGISGDVHTYA